MRQELISHKRKHDKPTCCRPHVLILALLRIINTAAKRWTLGNEEHCCMQQERRALKHRPVMWDLLCVRGKVSLMHLFHQPETENMRLIKRRMSTKHCLPGAACLLWSGRAAELGDSTDGYKTAIILYRTWTQALTLAISTERQHGVSL